MRTNPITRAILPALVVLLQACGGPCRDYRIESTSSAPWTHAPDLERRVRAIVRSVAELGAGDPACALEGMTIRLIDGQPLCGTPVGPHEGCNLAATPERAIVVSADHAACAENTWIAHEVLHLLVDDPTHSQHALWVRATPKACGVAP